MSWGYNRVNEVEKSIKSKLIVRFRGQSRGVRLMVVLDRQRIAFNANRYDVAIPNNSKKTFFTGGLRSYIPNCTFQELLRQGEEYICPHDPGDSPGTINIRVPMLSQPISSFVVNVKRDATVFESLGNVVQSQRHDIKDR